MAQNCHQSLLLSLENDKSFLDPMSEARAPALGAAPYPHTSPPRHRDHPPRPSSTQAGPYPPQSGTSDPHTCTGSSRMWCLSGGPQRCRPTNAPPPPGGIGTGRRVVGLWGGQGPNGDVKMLQSTLLSCIGEKTGPHHLPSPPPPPRRAPSSPLDPLRSSIRSYLGPSPLPPSPATPPYVAPGPTTPSPPFFVAPPPPATASPAARVPPSCPVIPAKVTEYQRLTKTFSKTKSTEDFNALVKHAEVRTAGRHTLTDRLTNRRADQRGAEGPGGGQGGRGGDRVPIG